MTPRLERIRNDLEAARGRVHQIAGALTATQWATRPAAEEWSVAECVVHLNLTSRAFLPLLDEALAPGRAPAGRHARARKDLVGWLVWLMTALRVPVKTTEPFVPRGPETQRVALTDFDTLQDEIIRRLERADGLDVTRLRVVSPFDARLRYNVYSALKLIAEHQALHLRQAERAARRVGGTGRGPTSRVDYGVER